MASKTQICNMAIAHCRGEKVTNIDTDTSNEAEQCLLFYDTALKFLLTNNHWRFSNITVALSLLSEEPLKWLYAYARPSDCLSIHRIHSDLSDTTVSARTMALRTGEVVTENEKLLFETGVNSDNANVIWTNEPDAYISYTKNQTDPSRYTPSFITSLAHYLATLIAVPVAGRKEGRLIMDDQNKFYDVSINQAILNNDIEKYIPRDVDSKMVSVRW